MAMQDEHFQDIVKDCLSLPRETEWVEFKHNNGSHDLLGKELSALANGANLHDKEFAYLIFGIADESKEVLGTNFGPRGAKVGNEPLEAWLSQMLTPKIDFRILEAEFEGKELVVFEVPAAMDRPIAFQNQEYIRVGSTTRPLKEYPDKERKIWSNQKLRSFEKQIAMSGLNTDEVLKFLDYSAYLNLTGQSLPSATAGIVEKMIQDKIVQKNKSKLDITNLGAALFARRLEDFEGVNRKAVRVIIYEGYDRNKTIKEQTGGKGYAAGFQGLITYINDQLPTNEEIGKAFRVDKKMYPEIAIRELVANALIHQDFNVRGAGPMVEVFEDRVEITNPGAALISTERFIDHSPQSRNEALAAFMRRIKVCEERGSGIDKVIFNVELFQLPAPDFMVTEESTKVTLFAHKALKDMSRADRVRACYQHCCLKAVSNQYMTNASLRERLNIADSNYPMASKIINDTMQANFIKVYDPDNTGSRKHAKYLPFWK